MKIIFYFKALTINSNTKSSVGNIIKNFKPFSTNQLKFHKSCETKKQAKIKNKKLFS